MLTRISAEFPFALKKNGILIEYSKNGSVKTDLDKDNPEFIEIIPLKQSVLPTCFLFDGDFICTPDKNIVKTDLKGAYYIKILPLYCLQENQKVLERKSQNAILSVYGKNLKTLTIATKNDLFSESLNGLGEVKTDFFNYSGQPFVYLFCSQILKIYSLSGQIKKVLDIPADEFYFQDKLVALKNYHDIAKHRITTSYTCNGNEFAFGERKVETSPYYSVNALNKRVIPVAFFEGVLCGEDLSPYLAENLIDKQNKLSGYLGNFTGVLPSPEFRSNDETGLLYQKDENLYEIKYCKTQLSGRKISNLKLID